MGEGTVVDKKRACFIFPTPNYWSIKYVSYSIKTQSQKPLIVQKAKNEQKTKSKIKFVELGDEIHAELCHSI